MSTVGLVMQLMRTLHRKVVKMAMSCAEEHLCDSLEISLILAKLHAKQALLHRAGNKLVCALWWRSSWAHASLLCTCGP